MKFKCTVIRAYDLLAKWAGPVTFWLLLLVVRIVWGWAFYQAGKGKLGNISQPIDYFKQLGIPLPTLNAWFVSLLECFGGLMMIVGIATRPLALMLAVDMIVAYIAADRDSFTALFTDSDMSKFSGATPFWFLVASLLLFATGPGLFSVDGLILSLRHRLRHDETPRVAPSLSAH